MRKLHCDLCGDEMAEPPAAIIDRFSGIQKNITIRVEIEGEGDVCEPCVRRKLRAMSLQQPSAKLEPKT